MPANQFRMPEGMMARFILPRIHVQKLPKSILRRLPVTGEEPETSSTTQDMELLVYGAWYVPFGVATKIFHFSTYGFAHVTQDPPSATLRSETTGFDLATLTGEGGRA